MNRFVLTRRAQVDLQLIWNYLAEESFEAADKIKDDLRLAMRELAEMPGKGHRRADVRNSRYRFWCVHSYIIAYFPDTTPLQIIRVIHGRRNFRRIF